MGETLTIGKRQYAAHESLERYFELQRGETIFALLHVKYLGPAVNDAFLYFCDRQLVVAAIASSVINVNRTDLVVGNCYMIAFGGLRKIFSDINVEAPPRAFKSFDTVVLYDTTINQLIVTDIKTELTEFYDRWGNA